MPSPTPPSAPRARFAVPALLLAVVAAALSAAWPASSLAKPKLGDGVGGVELRKLGEFDSPTYADNAPGFGKLLFVVEQPGTIRVLRRNRPLEQPFLNIRGLVECCGEEGLLSVAFPPDYERSGRFYVYYTVRGGNVNRVAEFWRTGPTTADPASARTVIDLPHPDFSNHNGGQLQFGPDGYLYIGTGDGGGGGDPDRNAQDPNSPLGKLLRIDPLPPDALGHGVPADNPLAGPTAGLDEIFSLGLRNPWRFSFDRKTGRIAIADVGQGSWEEVDYELPSTANGANFGWDAFEGSRRSDRGTAAPPGHQAPIFEYPNGGANCAVIGGYVVRDRKLKPLYGRYIYTDLCGGALRSFIPDLDGARKDRRLGRTVPSPTSFGEGVKGRIYVVSQGGEVWKLKRR
jgi:glucose/arabinose dehydrogenase